MNLEAKNAIMGRLQSLQQMPSIPASLYPLLKYMEQPAEKVSIQKIVDLISGDGSLAAQCLRFANSPLYGRSKDIDTIRGAVMALGLRRMQNIATSCCVLKILPLDRTEIDPLVFWEHSLGCALLCRHFAKSINFDNPEKAYLAGLLHDLGIVVNVWVLPKEFAAAVELARKREIPIHEAEAESMGITHCETGKILAEKWKFGPDLREVMGYHHDPAHAHDYRSLVALVSLTDLLCRMRGLGHGFTEVREIDFLEEPGVAVLKTECPELQKFDWARFTFELESHMEEVHQLVNMVYRAA
jgi:HD-like signal output (HDOD) protein